MLKSGAARLLTLFRWCRRKWASTTPSQNYIAAKLKCGVRTVQRYLRELVTAGYVTVKKRGQTSAAYSLVEKPVETCGKPVPNVVSGVVSEQLYLFSELETEVTTTTAGPSSDVQNQTRKGAQRCTEPGFKMPPQTTTNALGRVLANPDFAQVQEVLRGASPRIQRARNPVAYEQAILRREFPQHWRVA